ncbi:MAG: DUF366 family protein [Bdellovibrionales bacterium]|nr:DUF366 family protein [Bdellovibrionales bacterium]
MKTKFIDQVTTYDGSQLRSLFAYQTQNLLGDSIIAWCGKCDITNANMKDGEDLFAGEKIYSENMLHFIVEAFEVNLRTMVSLQRLLTSIIKDQLTEMKPDLVLRRDGDDIFMNDKKLNISIASIGPTSAMIHCGINISSHNTPVPTVSLEDLDIDAPEFADKILDAFSKEFESIKTACQKVFSL